jgi:hypothetical protein
VTPVFDGHSALITTLQSDEDGFQIDVDVSPGDVLHGPFHSNLGSSGLVWWAADDRGGHYLGQIGSWSSGPDRGQGEIHFWPALDPKARELRIMPTGETKRAVITVPLPRPGAAELRP